MQNLNDQAAVHLKGGTSKAKTKELLKGANPGTSAKDIDAAIRAYVPTPAPAPAVIEPAGIPAGTTAIEGDKIQTPDQVNAPAEGNGVVTDQNAHAVNEPLSTGVLDTPAEKRGDSSDISARIPNLQSSPADVQAVNPHACRPDLVDAFALDAHGIQVDKP